MRFNEPVSPLFGGLLGVATTYAFGMLVSNPDLAAQMLRPTGILLLLGGVGTTLIGLWQQNASTEKESRLGQVVIGGTAVVIGTLLTIQDLSTFMLEDQQHMVFGGAVLGWLLGFVVFVNGIDLRKPST